MTTATEFRDIFKTVVTAFQPRHITPETVVVYYTALRQLPPDVLQAAAQRLIATRRFFPTVHEWSTVARNVERRRYGLPDLDACDRCQGRGLIRVQYRSGDAFDIAICRCRSGLFFRTAGTELVRQRFALTTDHRVGYVEDFEDELDVSRGTHEAMDPHHD